MGGSGAQEGLVGQVRVLGPVQGVRSDGSVVELPSPVQRRIVGLLALHAPQAVRPELMHAVTGLGPSSLRTAVSRIRRILGEPSIVTTATGYRLALPVDATFAVSEIRGAAGDRVALERAVDRWHGPAYVELRDDPRFLGDAMRLDEIHAGAVEDLAELLLAERRCSDVVALLEPHIAEHPLRDRARGQMLRALALAGRQAEALRAFHTYRALLGEELGTEPSADVRRIEQRIAGGWDGVDDGPTDRRASELHTPSGAGVLAPRSVPGALSAFDAIVGRDLALGELAEVLRQTLDSRRLHVVLLSGEAGIGKTALAGAFARDHALPAGCAVRYGRCEETGFVALQPFRTVVQQLGDDAPDDVLERHVAHCGTELLRLAPRLSPRVGAAGTGTASMDDATNRMLLFEAVADLLVRSAALVPQVIVLDDLHWADPTALQLVRHLAAAADDSPVVLVLCSRDVREAGSEVLRAALAELARLRCRRIELANLDPVQLTELIRSLTGAERPPEAVVERLHTETAGNPLLASQLVRHWSAGGRLADDRLEELPASLRELIVARMTALGPGGTEVLTAAAVLGQVFDEPVLREMVDVDERTVDVVLDAALAAGLLVDEVPTARTMRFAHALVVKAVHAELQGPRRRRLHERAARAIEKEHDPRSPRVLARLAEHFALAGLPQDASRWAALAGEQALAQHAPADAVAWFSSALVHAEQGGCTSHERAGLLVRLGEARERAGDPGAPGTLLQAAEVARACGADDVLVRAAIATDRGFMRLGEFAPRQLQLVEWALAVVPDDDRRSRAHLLALLGQCLVHVGDHERRMVAALEALALTEGDDDLLARLGPGLQYALWSPDNAALRVELARRTIAAAVRVADPYLEFTAHSVAHNTAICVGDPLAAAASARRLRELADQFDSPRMRWMVRALDAFHLTMAARFDEAQVAVDETFALGSQMDEHDAFSIFASQYFVLGTFAGRHAELLEVVQLAGGAPGVKLPFRLAHAIIAAATGDEEIPRALLAERLDLGLDQIDPNLFWLTSIIGLAILTIELEDVASAQVLLPALLPFAAEVSFNGVTSQGPVAAYIGKLASLLGDHDLADVQLERAAEMAETFGWPYHRASTNVAQVEARLRRLGTFDAAASAALDAAEALCRELGIRTWSDKAAALRTRYAVAPPSP